MRKKLSLIAALIAFFAMTAVTFAANTAKITVTSEPITWKAPCDKAGAISISFDHNTTFVSGDIITGDLPLNVSLCRDIDFIAGIYRSGDDPMPYEGVTNFGNGTITYATGGVVTVPGNPGGYPNGTYNLLPSIGTDNLGPLTGDGFLTSVNGGVVFWVRGSVGSQRVTITVLSDGPVRNGVDEVDLVNLPSVTFNANNPSDVNSKMVLNILDQKVYPGSASGLYTDRDKVVGPNGTYDLAVVPAENTLCINVSHADFNNEYVKMSFDSKADKYTWIPSDPQIAHVVPQKTITLAACDKPACGYIPTPSAAGQGGTLACVAINNEAASGGLLTAQLAYATTADGYCAGTHRNNRLVLQRTDGVGFDAGLYQVQLEILVNGQTGDFGAYFAGPIAVAASSTLTGAANSASACEITTAGVPAGTPIYYNAANMSSVYQLDAAGTTSLTPAGDTDCTIAAGGRITKVKTPETSFFNGNDQDFLFVDVPTIIWDNTLLTEGKVLSVRVTLLKAPCGTLFTGDLCIGTRGCQAATNPDLCREYARTYPFFGKEADYVNVLGITNTYSTPLTFAVTVYEKDGDKFSGSITVGANQIQATVLSSLPSATLLAGSTGSGILGDSQSYAVVKTVTKATTTPFIGFAYLFDNVKKGQSFSSTLDTDLGSGTIVTCP